jgi:glucose-6-phosphate-specific signal transduction histidine kinase
VGGLVLFGDSAYLFNVEDLRQLGSLAEQLGVAIENARLRKRAAVALVIEERQRLARDLHDSVTQLLYSQTLFAEGAALSLREGQLERAQHCVSRLGETTYRALREMRLMIYRLRPADLADFGLRKRYCALPLCDLCHEMNVTFQMRLPWKSVTGRRVGRKSPQMRSRPPQASAYGKTGSDACGEALC